MNTFILSNVRIVTQYDIIENGFIYVKRGIIRAIGRSSPDKVHRSCNIIDGGGGWLLPGIIDIYNDLLGKGNSNSFFTLENNFASHGVTSVFHVIPGLDNANATHMNKLRRLGIIRHNFQTGLPLLDSYFLVSVPAINIEASNAGTIHAEASQPHSLTISDMISHHSMYIICSDNNVSPIIQTIFVLHHVYGVSIVDAVSMATINPARALGLERKFGSIEWGKIADLVLADESGNTPWVKKVFVSGCKVFDSISLEQSNII